MTVKISLQKGSGMKYHSHELRREVWTVASGSGQVVINDKERNVSSGDVIDIPVGTKHKIFADTDMSIIEVQIGGEISSADKKVFK